MNRLATSWALVKASAAVLASDKELLIFPIVSAIGTLLVTLTFAVPTFLAGIFDSALTPGGGVPVLGIVFAFLFYLAQYFVIFFANSALVGAALIRLRGGDPTVGDGFRIAFEHIGAIFGYALISATVGMLLRSVARRGGLFGQIVVSLIGLAWNIGTYLVVPVLVAENVGPLDAVKRSVTYLKRTWGEQITGKVGVGAVFGLLIFALIVLGVLAVVAVSATNSLVLVAVVVFVFVSAVLILSLLSSALSGIYSAAVYLYAAQGQLSEHFSRELVTDAFRGTPAPEYSGLRP
jgi:hypothetical protein